jgi:alpha-1,3-rhamnosyl/mannosyltransferase
VGPIAIDGRVISDRFPGIGRYVVELVPALARAAPEIELAVLVAPEPAGRLELGAAGAPEVRRISITAGIRSLATQWQVPRALAAAGIELFHATYWLTAFRPGMPAVLSLYDVIGLQPEGGLGVLRRATLRLGTALALRSARRVITLSEFSRRDVARRTGYPMDRIDVTPLGVSKRFQPPTPGDVAAMQARWHLAGPYILYVGSNKPHKGLDVLVEAWGTLAGSHPHAVLAIAGPWDRRYAAPMDATRRLGLEGRVRFLGPVAEELLPTLYGGAAAFAFPSRYEGFGLPPLEAMACGAPVVAADASSLPEVVGDAALLVPPNDAAALAAALADLLAPDGPAARLRVAGLARASRFSWRRTAETTLASYRSALAG